jgi:formate dehydrogenase alpha subunit
MESISLTVNKKPVSVPEGSTVLEAIREAGFYVPTLCAQEGLEPYGACRLCIVQIEGIRGLPSSCTTPAAEGMRVTTENDEIHEVRRTIVELLLADHPEDCLSCPQNQNCELQEVAHYLGIRERVLRPLERRVEVDQSNPNFVFDPAKCVLCGRCFRTCHEIVGAGAIDVVNRGFESVVAPFMGRSLADSVCESCGQCMASCPTGALSPRRHLPPEREEKAVCPYCGTGCGLLLGVRAGKVTSVRADPDSPVSGGQLCVKGRFGSIDYIHSPERLKAPLIRREGTLEESTWEEALDLVARRFGEYKGDSFAAFSSAKVANEDNYLLQKLTRAVQRSNNIDHCARL